jgi:hypothetical protein
MSKETTMKKPGWQRFITVIMACSLAAGTVSAQNHMAQATGNWTDPSVWTNLSIPIAESRVQIRTGFTVTVTNATPGEAVCKHAVLGDGNNGSLVIDGGHLTSEGTNQWNDVGYNRSAAMTIKNGGQWLCKGQLSVGKTASFSGQAILQMEPTSGTVEVLGDCRVGDGFTGATTPTATAEVNIDSGLLKINGVLFINTNAVARVDIRAFGKVSIKGDVTNTLNGYVAKGLLLGNSAVSNVQFVVEVTTNEAFVVETNTVVTAVPPPPCPYIGRHVDDVIAELISQGIPFTATPIYVRGVESGIVLAHNPPCGSWNGWEPIELIHQEIAPETIQNNDWVGSEGAPWNVSENWSLGDAPLRETQHYYVRVYQSPECVLDTAASAARLNINNGNLKLTAGADLYAGKLPIGGGTYWTAVGYDSPGTLTIEEGAKMETAAYLITGFTAVNPGISTINLNGGDLTIGGNIQMGSQDQMSSAVINISTGSVLTCTEFQFRDGVSNGTYSIVHLYDGKIVQNPSQTNALERLIRDGAVVVHAPAYSLSRINEKAVLQTYATVFAAWASQYGLAAGTEMTDSDGDGFNNLYEYAFNGNPTNSASVGTAQTVTNASGVLKFTFVERNDDPRLTYSVETTDDLVSGTWAAVGYTTETGRVTNGKYDTVTHTIPVTAAKKFVRVKVRQVL